MAWYDDVKNAEVEELSGFRYVDYFSFLFFQWLGELIVAAL